MKALSLTAPWAHVLFAPTDALRKHYETRSWRTSYRGTLAIHAAKTFPKEARSLLHWWPFYDSLIDYRTLAGWDAPFLPLACILGTVELVAIEPTITIRQRLTSRECRYGDYSDGRYAWEFINPVLFPKPIPARGALSLWEWTPPDEIMK